MWWIPLLILVASIGIASVTPIPVAKVKVGNETITITTSDIMYRFLWRPVMKGMEKALSRMPTEVQIRIAESITKELDKFEENAKILISTYSDVLAQYWSAVLDTVKQLNTEISGEAVPYVIVCGFKGVVQVCRLYELTETPGFVKLQDNVTAGTYLTIRVPYGILVAVNNYVEAGNYEKALKILLKRIARGDIECNCDVMRIQRMIQKRLKAMGGYEHKVRVSAGPVSR